MKNNRLSTKEWGERIGAALLFVAIGFLIIVVFSPLRPMLGRVNDFLGRIGLSVILFAAVLLLRKSKRFEKYGPIMFGLFILAVAVSLDRIFSIYVMVYLGVSDTTAAGWAIAKLTEGIVTIGVIVLLTRISGGSLGSIYLQKGNLKLGFTIGLVAFCIGAAGSIPTAAGLFKFQETAAEKMISWIPWLLIFVLTNAAMEELLFRGVFLRRLEPFYGKFISNFLIALTFSALHLGVTYATDQKIFVAIVFPLALAWGYLMQKTDSAWGSILFHAGMDIPIMIGIFSGL